MGRNYGLKGHLHMYDDIDMRNKYNHGFWHGTLATTLFWIIFIPSSLYMIGKFF